MATLTEVALDLSAKSSSTPPAMPSSPKPLSSPVPSLSSEGPEELERASSASSLSSRDSPPPPSSKPIAGPLPSIHLPTPTSVGCKEEAPSPPSVRTGAGAPNMRPFKMYPFEPMTSMYSQLSTQTVTAAAATAGLYPLGAMAGGTAAAAPQSALPLSLFDSPAVTLSSPITQYLQQRKRRHDARGSTGSTSSLESLGMVQSPSMDILSTPSPSPARDSDTSDPGAKKSKLSTEVDEKRDEAYWERRRKNNEAAKRSRDARRAKEEEIALRAAFLEQENLKLRAQVAILKNETAKLHYMLYNRL